MNRLLVEIGTEELPASFILPALKYLKERFTELFKPEKVSLYGTPRRLTVYLEGFKDEETEREELVFGPPKSVAFDEEGKPTKALTGFLKKQNASPEEVRVLKKNKGEYVALVRKVKEKRPSEKLVEQFEEILLSIPFPKRMRWTSSRRITFARPVRWIVALLNGRVLPLSFGPVKAGEFSRGHRFLAPEPFKVEPGRYEEQLKERFVLADPIKRLEEVKRGVEELARKHNARPVYPEGLLEEVSNLLEWPFPVLGSFPEKYLKLPPRVITTVLAHHQRFFCLERDGKLTNLFIGVSNNEPTPAVREGYERVVKARLEDALFFFEEDLKRPLKELVPELKGVLLHPKAGTLYDKTLRLQKLINELCGAVSCDEETRRHALEAAYLSKADLLTQMVRELDELQGYMGAVYARAQGYPEPVARAIEEQYRPVSADDEPPESLPGTLLALADKIDDLFTFFKAGELPTGSSDPYGLRRKAFGLIKILDRKGIDLDLERFTELYGRFDELEQLKEFIAQRLYSYLEGVPTEFVRAALRAHGPARPYRVVRSVRKLLESAKDERFKKVVESGRRVHRIIPKGWTETRVRPELFKKEEERKLYELIKELEGRELESPLELTPLAEALVPFFERVKVMEEDEALRRNRLALLKRAENLFHRFAHFDELVLKEGGDVS
ncbi:MAG: glycine--tRNA ligase subunit beta [Aquificae bacterium]|nr:glycine--tRNA ligase subunit beta [Aquificota bacterium]